MPDTLSQPLTLPCGATLPNRLAKAAMTERLADQAGRPTPRLERLYRAWSEGGAGLLITGNVIVDRHHLEAPGNVVLQGPQDAAARAAFKRWAEASTAGGNQVWMQLSHAGRQTQKMVNPTPHAPSAVALGLPGGQFGEPVAMDEAEILSVIERFGAAAVVARETGFSGVQVHAAHGYLASAFLSPRANQRDDQWGGDLAGRARFLLEVVRKVRADVGADFPVSVKLNSADFQRGGFAFADSVVVAGWLDAAGVDLIEISGGSYEQPAMMDVLGMEPISEQAVRASTLARESYFQRFAPEIRAVLIRAKLMVTGGFRTAAGMEAAVAQDGVDVIGLGRPLCVDAGAAGRLLRGEITELDRWEGKLRLGSGWLGGASPVAAIRALNTFAAQGWYYEQLVRLGDTGRADPGLGVLAAFIADQRRSRATARAWRASGQGVGVDA